MESWRALNSASTCSRDLNGISFLDKDFLPPLQLVDEQHIETQIGQSPAFHHT